MASSKHWPEIPYDLWSDSCTALHLYCQIIGKYRLAHTPWVNHAWHATLYVSPTGLSTGVVPDAGGIEIRLDLVDHRLISRNAFGETSVFKLRKRSVAEFEERFRRVISDLGGDANYHGRPNEIADAIPFAEDVEERPWDRSAVTRYSRALVFIDNVFRKFRTGFIGKVSPVHLFWGSFDLAVTRFSGRKAPPHPGGIVNLPDEVTREAYSHEVSSAGFWPGGGGIDEPSFYSYAYPAPPGFAEASVLPADASFNSALGEFVLSYDSVRRSSKPEATLLEFLQSTYAAAADAGEWPRQDLECAYGVPGKPRRQ